MMLGSLQVAYMVQEKDTQYSFSMTAHGLLYLSNTHLPNQVLAGGKAVIQVMFLHEEEVQGKALQFFFLLCRRCHSSYNPLPNP